MLGNTYLLTGKASEAQSAFERLTLLEPNNPVGYFRLGVLQRMLKQYDLALKNFEKALSINPRLMDVFTNMMAVYAVRKEFDLALTKCDQQIKKAGNGPAVLSIIYNLKGELYLAKEEKAKAEEFFSKAIKENPDYVRPYYSLARIYLADKNEEKAIAQYQAVLDKNPQQAGPHMLMGIIYDVQKRYDLSEKHYRSALKVDPDFAPAANNLAYLLTIRDKAIDEALGLARKAKEKLPEDPNVMDTLGLVYYKKGLYDSAISEFSDSLAKLPDNAIIHYHLGLAYHKKGEKDKARSALDKALKLEKGFDGADEARRILAEM